MNYRKFKIFLMNHGVKIAVVAAVLVTLILGLIGMQMLESFYFVLMLAQAPWQVLLMALNAVIFAWVIINMQTGSLLKFKKGTIKSETVTVGFNDVIGLEEAKREAMEVVSLIKDHAKLRQIGGKIVKGILMVGPPGCGKTLLAKAIAKEAGIPFLSVAGSEFVEVFVGMGASRVRKLFKKARQLAYAHGACIVFIDELEVVGRGRTYSFLGGEETNSTQNQLLVEMDGLNEQQENIIVIGATNAQERILDQALLRPGRFDRKIFIDRPGLQEREDLFRYYLGKVKADPNVDIPRLARNAVYKSPADIENIVKEAALIALRNGKEVIGWDEISAAIDRIDLGIKYNRKMTPREREMVAYHETGHLVVLYRLHPTDDVFKASIVSRGGALGMVVHQPREELFTENTAQLLANVKVCLGGYTAERLKYQVTTTGVSSDFQKATALAHAMVWSFGMGSNGFLGDYTAIPQGQLAEDVKQKLNAETHKIIRDCYEEVEALLKKEWLLVERFVQELLAKDELKYDEIDAIVKAYDAEKTGAKG
ncbi:MAG: AAA family ATPase [Elusimicrobia bacterium]|nr:AAA family ATPase [Elusimicrobiota bacterium]